MQVKVDTPDLNPTLRRLAAMIRNKAVFVKAWANDAAKEAQRNAKAKPGRRWWRDLARSIRMRSASETAAEVSSDQVGATLKQFGGIVRPKNKRALTIPIAPEAKGKTVYSMKRPKRPLFVLPGTRLLGYATPDKGFRALFVLAPKAVQKPDPWFPAPNRLYRLGIDRANYLIKKEQIQWNTLQ